MKCLTTILSAVLFLAVAVWAQSKTSRQGCAGLSDRTVELIVQYKELRLRRHALPVGTFDQDVSGHGGKLHTVLSALGVELGRPPFTKKFIVECLGEPDAVHTGKQMTPFLGIYDRERQKTGKNVRPKRNREYLIYYWRGWHDFMFYIVEGGRIVDHGWWFAYE